MEECCCWQSRRLTADQDCPDWYRLVRIISVHHSIDDSEWLDCSDWLSHLLSILSLCRVPYLSFLSAFPLTFASISAFLTLSSFISSRIFPRIELVESSIVVLYLCWLREEDRSSLLSFRSHFLCFLPSSSTASQALTTLHWKHHKGIDSERKSYIPEPLRHRQSQSIDGKSVRKGQWSFIKESVLTRNHMPRERKRDSDVDERHPWERDAYSEGRRGGEGRGKCY